MTITYVLLSSTLSYTSCAKSTIYIRFIIFFIEDNLLFQVYHVSVQTGPALCKHRYQVPQRDNKQLNRLKTAPCIKYMQGAALVGGCFLMYWDDDIWSRKSSLSNGPIRGQEHCTAVYNNLTQTFTTLESSHRSNHLFLPWSLPGKEETVGRDLQYVRLFDRFDWPMRRLVR